jgi:hypothetical protein
MEQKEVNDVVLSLSAAMAGMKPEEFADKMTDMASDADLNDFDKLINKLLKKDITPELYMNIIVPLASQLNHLWCFCANMNLKPRLERVDEMLSRVNKFRLKWARKQSRGNCTSEARPIVKYAINGLGRRRYIDYDYTRAAQYLIDEGLVFFRTRDNGEKYYCVLGLHLAVGDNTFSFDRNGQQFRNYVTFCAPEAFPVDYYFAPVFKELDNGQIPELPAHFETMYVDDHKGCCKISVSQKDKNRIREFLRQR